MRIPSSHSRTQRWIGMLFGLSQFPNWIPRIQDLQNACSEVRGHVDDSLKQGWVYGYLDERRWFWSEWIGESKRKMVEEKMSGRVSGRQNSVCKTFYCMRKKHQAYIFNEAYNIFLHSAWFILSASYKGNEDVGYHLQNSLLQQVHLECFSFSKFRCGEMSYFLNSI